MLSSTLDVKQFNGVEFPEKYYPQCVHYMAVTGAEWWYLAVLVFGRGFFTYTLERDHLEIDALMSAESAFWAEHVLTDTPPAPDGSPATTDALQVVYADSRDEELDLFGRDPMLNEYMMLKRQKKSLDERIDEIENNLKEDLREAERGRCGSFRISWKTQTRSTFQTKEFAKAYPGIDLSPFYKISSSRPFKVTEKRDEETV